MPASYPDAVIEEAKRMYQDGRPPGQIAVIFQLKGGRYEKFHRATITSWAKRYGWGSWREARTHKPDRGDPSKAFAISGISDPIFHLSCVRAKRLAHAHVQQDQKAPTKQIIFQTLLEVADELDPGAQVYSALYPIIHDQVRQTRKEMKEHEDYLSSEAGREDQRKELAAWHRDNPER
ncbi:MAG: hypothetical protein IH956_01355 [Chloroflexi bacterium]|nr:hypothetical protein [Chloroflexota bacterium]